MTIHDAVKEADADPRNVAGARLTNDRLRSIVDRIERLGEERAQIASDIKDIFTEAASAGYDKKALRALIAERKKDPTEVRETGDLLDLYRAALA